MERSSSDPLLLRYQALLAMADLLAHAGDREGLFEDLARRLKNVVSFELLNLTLYDPAQELMRLNVWVGVPGPGIPLELPVKETVSGWVCEHQEPLVFSTVESELRFPRIMAILREHGIRSYCSLPLTCGEHRIGALGFGSGQPAAYDQQDL